MIDEKRDPDFAYLPPVNNDENERPASIGRHHALETGDAQVVGEAFHHPERDVAGTLWEPNWEPIETYQDGQVVMLDDGARQMFGRRDMGMWMELVGGDELAQPDYKPMLWSFAPEQVKYDMM